MKKTERLTKNQLSQRVRNLITIDLPDGELDDVIDECDEIMDESYDAGYNLGYDEGKDEGYQSGREDAFSDESRIEKANTEYCVQQFADCKTLEDFQCKLTEITNRSYNFM